MLVDWNPRHLYSKLFEDRSEMERFLRDVCTMEWHGRHDGGEPMARTAAELKAAHPGYSSKIDAWRTRWPEMFAGPKRDTAALVEMLDARSVTQHALTNFPGEKWEAFATSPDYAPILSRFGHITVSGAISARKPDRAAFAHAERHAGIRPETTLFFDDTAINVEAAREIGYDAVLFTDAETARDALRKRGLI